MTGELERQLSNLRPGDHLCPIYESEAERWDVAVLLVKQGLERGELCLHVADESTIAAVAAVLARTGIDVEMERARGRLRLVTKREAYLQSGRFAARAMIEFLQRAEEEARRDGFSGLRIIGEMTWALAPDVTCEQLIRFEALLNEYLPGTKTVIACQYHRSHFDPAVLLEVLRTHPVVVLNEHVCPNPYYEPPHLLLGSTEQADGAAARLEWWISQIGRAREEMGKLQTLQQHAEVERARFETMLRQLPVGVAVFEAPTGRLLLGNDALVRIWRRPVPPMTRIRDQGKYQGFHADGRPYQDEEWPVARTLLRGEEVVNEEIEILRGDGSRGVVMASSAPIRDAAGQVVAGVMTIADISEQRQSEERRRILNAVLEHAVEGMSELDPKGRYVRVNRAYAELLGLTPEEMRGMPWWETVAPEDRDRADAARHAMLRDGRSELELRGMRKDGSRFWKYTVMVKALDQQGGFIGHYCFSKEITERKAAEERLRQYAERLEALSRRLVEVQEDERRSLARELHDEIGQLLTSLRFAIDGMAPSLRDTGVGQLDQARALIDEALRRVRELSFDLRPALLDHLGLIPALSRMIERYTTSTGVRVDLQYTGIEGRLAPQVETAAYRIVQEALTNTARYAGVYEASVRLWVEGGTLHLQVEDRGAGFDAAEVLASGRSNGLPGMQERLLLLGGRLHVESTPGSGTHLLAELPLVGGTARSTDEHFNPSGG